MTKEAKTSQLQIRVSPARKAAIRRQAKRAGMSMSDWVLSRVLPSVRERFQDLLAALSAADHPAYGLAELNEFLSQLAAGEFTLAVAEPPRSSFAPYLENYVAAMVELAAMRKNTKEPSWTAEVEPLAEPVFGSSLLSLRLHLLTHAPPPFRARNIFIDSSIGDRV